MKKLLSMIAIASVLAFTWSCDDEATPDTAAPTVLAPTGITSVASLASASLTFDITAAGGFKSVAVTQVGGSTSVTSQPEVGSGEGDVVVSFTAGASAGAGSVTVTVTDNTGKTSAATAVVNVTIPDGPTTTAPTSTSVTVSQTVNVSFAVVTPGGYKSAATSSPVGGTAATAFVSQPAVGATSGNVVVAFTAGSTAGAGALTLTTTDNNNKTGFATAVINISASPVPTISGIPTTASIVAGNTLTVPNVVLTAADGFAASNAFTLSVDGGAATNLAVVTGATASPATVTLNYPTTLSQVGTRQLVFTLTDATGDAVSFTHILTVTQPTFTTVVVTSNITANTTWTSDKIYELAGRIAVTGSDVTLTIQPGTIIKGQSGTGPNASALIIARGANIDAAGTAAQPIIFTSTSDQIVPGQIASPNLLPTVEGLWGGLIILGAAEISVSSNTQNQQIEGIPPSDPNGAYGGNDNADNSGVIRYVSIRNGGANIGEGNEINGLTLGGVGSGTVIEYVEVVANQDDGIEFFGGSVNVTNALVWNSGDDAIDTDQSWRGILDNFVVICGTNTDHGLEVDGPEGTLIASHTVRNGSVKGHPKSELADFRSKAQGSFQNIYFFNFPDPDTEDPASTTTPKATLGRGDLSLSNSTGTTDVTGNFAAGTLSFSNLQVTLPARASDATQTVLLTKVFRSGTDVHATNVALKVNSVGADKTKFTSWTWADVAGQLVDFK